MVIIQRVFNYLKKDSFYLPAFIILLCYLYLLIFATPPFLMFRNPDATAYWPFINYKIDNLFMPIEASNDSHQAKLNLRLTVPLIGKLLPTSSSQYRFTFIMLVKWLMGIYFYYLLYQFTNKYFKDKKIQIFVICSFVTIYTGKSFVNGVMWFDEFAFFFLLISMTSKNNLIIFLSVIFAVFVDERAFFSCLIVYTYKLYECGNYNIRKLTDPFSDYNFVVWGLVIALLLRIIIEKSYGLNIKTENGGFLFLEYFRKGNLDYLIIGLFAAFKTLWIFIIVAGFILFQTNQKLILFLFFSGTFLISIVSFSVWDLTRSLNFCFPALILSYRILADNYQNKHWFNSFVFLLIGLSFFIPPIMVSDKIDIYHNIFIKLLEHRW